MPQAVALEAPGMHALQVPPAVVVSVFPDVLGYTLERRSMSWPDVVEMIRRPDEWPTKAAMPLLKLATFGDMRSPERIGNDGRRRGNSLRHDANVVEVYGIEADYDRGQMPMGEALQRLEAAGVRCVLYSSASHRPEAPRWRVLAPLAAPHPPEARAALVARLNGVLGGVLAGESFTLALAYYFGRVAGVPYQTAVTFDDPLDGTCIDELDELDEIAIGRPTAGTAVPRGGDGAMDTSAQRAPAWQQAAELVQSLGRRLQTNDGRRELLKSYIGSRSVRGFDRAEVTALVSAFADAYFDPADPLDDANIDAIVQWACGRDAARRAHGAAVADAIAPHAAGVPSGGDQQPAPETKPPAYVSFVDLDENPPPPREWVIDEWLPLGSVTALFSGGGFGKSLLCQQIATHVANGVPVFGRSVRMGPALGYFTEDDTDELRRRQVRILANMARTARFSTDGLHLAARAGEHNTLMLPEQFGREMIGTAFGWQVVGEVQRLRPTLLILDNLAQLYGGIENDRFMVTQFCNWLSWLALKFRCAVLLLGHVAKAEGSQFSGSTAWDAAVRSRLWLERHEDGTLELHKSKANYSARESIRLEYTDGSFAQVEQGRSGAAETLMLAQAKRDVLQALDVLTARQVATSQAPTATTFLPRLADKEGLLGATNLQGARRALAALIDEGVIGVGQPLPWRTNDRKQAQGLARNTPE